MKIEYSITPENMKVAAAIAYKTKVLKKKLLLLSVIYVFLLYNMSSFGDVITPVVLFVVFALLLLLNRFLYIRRCTHAPFKGKANSFPHTMKVSEEGLNSTTPTTSSQVSWDHFVSFTSRPAGVLLYPQKNIFYFVPSTAKITGGSWEGFKQLLEKNISIKA